MNTVIDPGLIYLSQQHLNQWDECPLKFRYSFFDQVRLPFPPEQQDKLTLGSQFHLLLQQQELGLDITDLAASHPKLIAWYQQFQQRPPQIILGERHCETRRTFALEVNQHYHYFTVVYDLLVLGTDQAQILDWKTHEKLIPKTKLQSSWQTRLYFYGLVATSHYEPEAISMTYWFAGQGKSTILNYSRAQHEKTYRDLQQKLAKMQHTNFPAQPKNVDSCSRCEFYYRCDAKQKHHLKSENANHHFDLETMADFEAYPEVIIE
ncbi:MAG: PD-(D/E)XK nuclease family protein [Pseudanabaena sp. ELA607]|jgi:hypothetical protein